MADSDEEYERRRRDKFRRERNDVSDRRDDRRGGRDQWEDRGSGRDNWSSRSRDRNREMYRDYDRGNNRRGERYSPQRHDLSPPQMKRMRRDWDEGGGSGYGHYDSSYGGGQMRGGHSGGAWGHGDMPPPQQTSHYSNMSGHRGRQEPDFPTQPAMMTFKLFLTQQDDNISDEEAIKKYNEYKVDFKRQQINEFFLTHKDEEWFKSKYHPEECEKRKEEARQALKRRADVFVKLFEMGRIEAVSVDLEKSPELVKVLDAGVILMEGGSDFDLTALEMIEPEPEQGRRSRGTSETVHERTERAERREQGGERTERGERAEQTDRAERSEQAERDSTEQEHEERTGRRDEDGNIQVTIDRKRKRKRDMEPEQMEAPPEAAEPMASDPTTQALKQEEPEQEEVEQHAAPTTAAPAPVAEEDRAEEASGSEDEGDSSDDSQSEGKGKGKHQRDYNYESGSDSSSNSSSGSDSEPGPPGVEDEPETPAEEGLESAQQVDGAYDDVMTLEPAQQVDGTVDDDKADPEPEEGEEEDEDEKEDGEEKEKAEPKEGEESGEPEEGEEGPQPRALHKTCSIFLRNLAPTITKQEVEAMCKRYPGFMRVALQDPQPERRFLRRGWVTFERTVNIVDICWNLNNIRLRDCEMGAIVNRDLKQRVRPVNGITSHKQVVKADIKHAARIVQALDAKWKIWEDKGEEKKDKTKEEEQQSFGLVSKNPVLKNITDYLVEEGSFEEEELLGVQVEEKPKETNPELQIERDEELLKVLDRMILYLRIVHSFDFYSAVEYPNEDEMPHRCGIMHARGPAPPNRIMQNDINDWMSQFESKVKPFAKVETEISEVEAAKLGKKDVNTEVEKFITANTQELGKEKWLCPLSGKKFKGPEFIRKHIFNKHAEKIEEVKQEVVFFDNYLMDPRRPHLPEHPGSRGTPSSAQPRTEQMSHGGSSYGAPPQPTSLLGYNTLQQRGGGMMSGYQESRNRDLYAQHRGPRNNFAHDSSKNPILQLPQLLKAVPMGNRNGHRGGQGTKRNQSGFYNRGGDNFRNDRPRDRFGGGRRTGGRSDPRSIIEYRDLDAPEDMDIF